MLPSFSFDSGADEIEFRAEGTALAAEYRVFFCLFNQVSRGFYQYLTDDDGGDSFFGAQNQ